jgi:hypothetical protein
VVQGSQEGIDLEIGNFERRNNMVPKTSLIARAFRMRLETGKITERMTYLDFPKGCAIEKKTDV